MVNLRWLLNPGPKLTQRVVHAGFWALSLRMTIRVLKVATTIILARILAPEDFGLMGIALLATVLLQNFTQTGFQDALIQRVGDIRPYLHTAWTMSLMRGVLLASLLVLSAPLIAGFFGEPRATPLLQVIALAMVFNGLTSIGVVYFQKDLEFQRRFILITSEAATEAIVGITLALLLRDVWALVYANVAAAAVRLAVSYVMRPYLPRFTMEWSKARELFSYGKWVFGATSVNYLVRHLDDLVVGKLIGATGLGLYRMAYTQSELATDEVTKVAGQVLFPAYSKLQGRKEDLRRAYLRSVSFFTFLSFPLSFGFLFLAEPFTQLVLGEKWLPMVPALQALIIMGIGRGVAGASNSLFAGIGRPDLNTKFFAAKAVLLGLLVYPLVTTWGITGAALAVLAAGLPVDMARIFVANRLVQAPASSLFQVALFPTLTTLVMLLTLYIFQSVVHPYAGIIHLVSHVVVGGLVYGAGVLLCRVAFGYTIGGILSGKQMRAIFSAG